MKYGRYGLPYLFLRISLGLTLIFMGTDVFRHPEAWITYVSSESIFGFNQDALLRFGGMFDIVIGLMLVVKIMPKLAGSLIVIHLLGIFIGNGFDSTLARNISLLGTSMAIAMWPSSYHKKSHWGGKKLKKSKRDEED